MESVRSKTGAPIADDFRNDFGTPIVIDRTATTGRAYFLDDAGTIREVGDYSTTQTVATLLNLTGGQIKFPATEVPSADANTLDDYEESATTPTVTSGTGAFTSVSCALKYTKIGNRVLFNAAVTITTNGTAATSVIVPLPFSAAELTALYGSSSASVSLVVSASGANATLVNQTGTYPGADGVVLIFGGQYRV